MNVSKRIIRPPAFLFMRLCHKFLYTYRKITHIRYLRFSISLHRTLTSFYLLHFPLMGTNWLLRAMTARLLYGIFTAKSQFAR